MDDAGFQDRVTEEQDVTHVDENGAVWIIEEPAGKCELCGAVEETRPYGPGGKQICFACGEANAKERDRRFAARDALERLREERDATMRYCMNVHGDMLCDGPRGHDGGCTFTAGWMLARRIEDDLISTSLYAGDTTNELRGARDDRDEGWRQHNRAEIRAEAAEAEVRQLREERDGYKRDFMAASERVVRLELIIADLNPDGGSKGFSGGI